MKIKVGVSNRHIHLTRADADVLFGENYEFTKRNDLTQPGEYACEEVVKVSTNNHEFPYVRVLGPLRNYTQVEVSKDDADLLGIDPPIRDSGELENSSSVYLEGPNGKIFKENCCIRATRHIHCNKSDNLGYTKNDIVKAVVGDKILDDIHIKENDNYVLELHIDKTDAALFGLNNGDYIDLE